MTPHWTQRFPTGGPPTGRSNNAGREYSTAVYDPVTNRLIVFGGAICDPCTHLNDVWVLTNANGLGGTSEWQQLFPAGGPPDGRTAHSAVYDSAGNRMVIFGGTNGPAVLGDTWVLADASGLGRGTGTPITPVWTRLADASTPRQGHGAAYDAATNRMVIFGGVGAASFLNDVSILDNANGTGSGTFAWSPVFPAGTPPSPRIGFHHYQLYDGTSPRMLLFGGLV